MKFLPLFAVAVMVLMACHTIKPAVPDLPPSTINSTPLSDSRIDVPVTIDLKQVLNELTAKIPAALSGEGSAGPAQYRWTMQRQPFNLTLSGDSVHITCAAHFAAGGYLKNPLNGQWSKIRSCDADITMGISAAVKIVNNYSLPVNARLTQFDLNTCDLTIAQLNLAPVVKAQVINTIGHYLDGLNQQFNNYDLRALLQPVWNALDKPVKVADMGYIAINPSAISLGRPSGSGNLLTFTAGITARPVFYLGDQGKRPDTPMPDISATTNGDGFNLTMDVHLAYGPLNKMLHNALADKRIVYSPKSYIIINDAGIYGSGNDHLLVKVRFSGRQGVIPYHGILYFTCIPGYDTSTGNLYISDIDFDVNTATMLREGPAAWILNAALKEYLNSQVHFNIADKINGIRNQLNQSLNRPAGPHIALAGSVDSLSLRGILPLKDNLLMRINIMGSLAVKVE